MEAVFDSLLGLFGNLADLFVSLGLVLLPWLPLAAWVLFWLYAVDWVKLYDVLIVRWGLIGVVLIGLVMALVWGVIAPPSPDGVHRILGLTLSNFVGKTVHVTTLLCIMGVCGAAQLSGVGRSRFEQTSPDAGSSDATH